MECLECSVEVDALLTVDDGRLRARSLRLVKAHWTTSEAARQELQEKLQAANEDFANQIKQTLSLSPLRRRSG